MPAAAAEIASGFNALKHTLELREKKEKKRYSALKTKFADLSKWLEEHKTATDDNLQLFKQELQQQIDAMELKLAPHPSFETKTERPAEIAFKSADYQSMISGRNMMPPSGNGVVIPSLLGLQQKDYPIDIGAAVGDLVDPYIQQRIRMQPLPRVRTIDLVNYVPAPGTNIYRYKRETELSQNAYLYTQLAADVVSGAGTDATLDSTAGVWEGQTHRFHTAGGIETAVVDSFVAATGVVTYTGVLNFDALENDAVTAADYAGTAESAVKPWSYFSAEDATVNLIMIATLMEVTQQSVSSVRGLDGQLRRKMPARARRNINTHLLYGVGAAGQMLNGFFLDTNIAQLLWSTLPAGSNQIDCLMTAGTQIETNGYGTPVLVVHPDNWLQIMLLKDDTGQYLKYSGGVISVIDMPGMQAIGRFPVVLDERLQLGDFLAADFTEVSDFVDGIASAIAVGLVNDQFARNAYSLRYEDFLAHAIATPGAAIRGQFDAAP